MYWTARGGTVTASRLDGSGKQLLASVSCGETRMGDIAVDSRAEMIYWIHFTDCRSAIERVSTSGGSVEKLPVIVGRSFERGGIAVDVERRRLYWTSNRRNHEGIYRGNLDGTGREDVLTGLGDGADLAVDGRSQQLYWSETDTGKIRRANLDGTGAENVFVELPAPTGVALDMLQDY